MALKPPIRKQDAVSLMEMFFYLYFLATSAKLVLKAGFLKLWCCFCFLSFIFLTLSMYMWSAGGVLSLYSKGLSPNKVPAHWCLLIP